MYRKLSRTAMLIAMMGTLFAASHCQACDDDCELLIFRATGFAVAAELGKPLEVVGEGRGTPFGPSTYTSTIFVADFFQIDDDVFVFRYGGDVTWTTTDGSVVTGTLVGGQRSDRAEFWLFATFDGGTGRFQDATGGYLFLGRNDTVGIPAPGTPVAFVGFGFGEICTPDIDD